MSSAVLSNKRIKCPPKKLKKIVFSAVNKIRAGIFIIIFFYSSPYMGISQPVDDIAPALLLQIWLIGAEDLVKQINICLSDAWI